MIELLLTLGGKPNLGSQVQWTIPGTYQWRVPKDVTEVSVLLVGAGSQGSAASGYTVGGYGGAIRWKNKVQVIPGDVITVVVGNGGTSRRTSAAIVANLNSISLRSTVFSLYAGSYADASSITTDMGGGNGGVPALAQNQGRTCDGGSVARINRDGLSGDLNPSQGIDPRDLSVVLPTLSSPLFYTESGSAGGGGQARSNTAGDGGSNATIAGGHGAVRIIWGKNRAYPTTNVTDAK